MKSTRPYRTHWEIVAMGGKTRVERRKGRAVRDRAVWTSRRGSR